MASSATTASLTFGRIAYHPIAGLDTDRPEIRGEGAHLCAKLGEGDLRAASVFGDGDERDPIVSVEKMARVVQGASWEPARLRHGFGGAHRPCLAAELHPGELRPPRPELLRFVDRPLPESVVALLRVHTATPEELREPRDIRAGSEVGVEAPDHFALGGIRIDDHGSARSYGQIAALSRDFVSRDGFRSDEDERHSRNAVRAIGPGVARRALDRDVARLERRLALVDEKGDLAFQHDGVVERVGAVEPEVLVAGVLGAVLGLGLAVDLVEDRISAPSSG